MECIGAPRLAGAQVDAFRERVHITRLLHASSIMVCNKISSVIAFSEEPITYIESTRSCIVFRKQSFPWRACSGQDRWN